MTSATLTELISKLSISAPTKEVVAAAKADWRSVEKFTQDLADKLSTVTKKNTDEIVNALRCISSLAQEAMTVSQPYLIQHLNTIISVCGAKQANNDVRNAAEEAVKVSDNNRYNNTLIIHHYNNNRTL